MIRKGNASCGWGKDKMIIIDHVPDRKIEHALRLGS
jgi:hypothetical protein